LKGWDALFIDKRKRQTYREELQDLFKQVGDYEKLEITKDGYVVRTFYMITCTGFKGKAVQGAPQGGNKEQ